MKKNQWFCVMEELGIPVIRLIEIPRGTNKSVKCLYAAKSFEEAEEFLARHIESRERLLAETMIKSARARKKREDKNDF